MRSASRSRNAFGCVMSPVCRNVIGNTSKWGDPGCTRNGVCAPLIEQYVSLSHETNCCVDYPPSSIVPVIAFSLPAPHELLSFQRQADPMDLPILTAAVREQCNWLVTFNLKYFQPGRPGIEVHNPDSFISKIRSQVASLLDRRYGVDAAGSVSGLLRSRGQYLCIFRIFFPYLLFITDNTSYRL